MQKLKATMVSLLFLIFGFVVFSYPQQDNGNHFEKTWAADISQFKGDWGEIGVYAEEGLDIDKNGKREFIVYDHVKGLPRFDRLQVWEARGDNDFWLAWEVRFNDWQTQLEQGHGLTVADLDFDGNQEVLIATEGVIYIYESDGTTFEAGGGLPTEPTQTLWPIQDNAGQSNIRQLRVANLDSDPELEIFMGYTFTSGLFCVIGSLPGSDLSNPDWKFEFADDFPYYVGGVNINDFDGDGNMEIFVCHVQDAPVTRLYENTGPDSYEVKFTTLAEDLALQPSFDDAIADPVFYDFDGDGKKELLIADIHGKVFIITYDASNGFTDFGPSAWTYLLLLPDVQPNGFVRTGILNDLDQDGKPDIYYNDMTAKAVLDLEYQGGPVTDPNSWLAYEIYKGHPLIIGYIYPAGDLDGDGQEELVIAASAEPNGNLQVIESTDTPSFVSEKFDQTPTNFVLYQNYPNPFSAYGGNPSTNIEYELHRSGHVKLEVFSVLGERVATLVDEYQTHGLHKIKFDANQLSNQIYIYRLTTDKVVEQRKMILLK